MPGCNCICQGIKSPERLFISCSPDNNRINKFGFYMGYHSLDHIGSFSTPPIGTDYGCKPHLWPENVGKICCIDHERMRTEQHRRCSEDNCCRIDEGHSEVTGIGHRHIERLNGNSPLYKCPG